MSTVFAFVGILLVSLVVGSLAALPLADFFQATEEFILVIMALVAAVLMSLMIFGVAYAAARRVGALAAVAALLCLAVLGLVALPSIIDMRAGRAALADSFAGKNLALSLEILVPAAVAILTQWGLVRHRWLRVRGREELSPWPWVTTVIAGLVILNPMGLEIVSAGARPARPGVRGQRAVDRRWVAFSSMPPAAAQIQAGTLRALAVTGEKLIDSLPGIPTMIEAGYPGQTGETPVGIFVQTGTPKEVGEIIRAKVVKIIAMPDVKAKLASVGFVPIGDTPEEFTAYLKAEGEKWGKLINALNLKSD